MNGLMPRTASVSDLQRDYKSLLDELELTKEPIILLKDNKAKAALVDIGEFEKLYMIKQDHEAQKIKEAVASFRKAEREGKILSANSVDELFKMVVDESKKSSLQQGIYKRTRKTVSKGTKKS